MRRFELIAPCHFGMESVLKREITDLGYDITDVADGRVTFFGDEEALCRANIFLRTAERILIKIGNFHAETFEELFDWQEYERMSFLARRSEQGCIDLIETVWKKMDSLHKTEDKAESTIAKLKKYIEENLGGELTRSVLAGQVIFALYDKAYDYVQLQIWGKIRNRLFSE